MNYDNYDMIKRLIAILPRLQELLPLAEEIDNVAADIVPEIPHRKRRRMGSWVSDDEKIYDALQVLPTLGRSIRSAHSNIEDLLEEEREEVKSAAQAELREVEDRASELRRLLDAGPESDEAPTDQDVEPAQQRHLA